MSLDVKKERIDGRIHWMDNLRSVIILLVVMYHVGGVYEAAGLWGWFWIVDDPSTITWVGILGIMFDVLVMPTMFFISGYLTPFSLTSRSSWEFVKGKARRLMLPWLVAVVTLIPTYKFIFLYSRGLPQEDWTTYFHLTNPNSQNWLWFLPVLFLFNMIYLLLSKTKWQFPNISIKATITGIFFIGLLYSFGMGSWLGMRSWTLTPILDFENERLFIYFMMFLLGALCFKRDAFTVLPASKKLYNIFNGIAWIPITGHIFVRLIPFFYPEGFATTPLFKVIWWLSFNLSLLVLMYVMIETFWRYFNKTGKIWNELNKNSYGVYIIHVISIGIFGTLLLNTSLPALVKYFALIILTYGVSNLLVSLYRSGKQLLKG